MENNFVIAIDMGTTSTKGLAVQPDGKALSNFKKEYPTHYPKPGYAEQDPDEVFLAVVDVITEMVNRTGTDRLAAITFSCAMHTLIGVDSAGKPLTPIILWGDTRSSKQAERVKASNQWKELYFQSGTPIHPMSPFFKMLWMKEEQPDLFTKVHKFISIKEYVFARFFGEYVVDYSIASATGLFDNQLLKWSSYALRILDMSEEKLSKPVSTFHICKGLKPEFATRLKLPKDVPFVLGANDGCLAHLGCGASKPGDLSVTVGTSGAVRMASTHHCHDSHGRIFNYRLDEKTYVSGGATNNGAVLLSWFDRNISGTKPDTAAFDREAFSIPNSEGLIFLPYLQGERAPINDPHARGVFFGVNIQHTRAHFKRAILEGICFELKSIMGVVEKVVHPVERVLASGGIVKSEPWVQLLADILDKPVTVDSLSDASSLGAALQGFQALGIATDFDSNGGKEKLFSPNGNNRRHYQKTFEIWDGLYGKLKDDFKRLSEL